MRDPRAHRPAADDGHIPHLARRRAKLVGRALPGALAEEEQPDEVACRLRIAQLHDGPTLCVEACTEPLPVPDVDHIQ